MCFFDTRCLEDQKFPFGCSPEQPHFPNRFFPFRFDHTQEVVILDKLSGGWWEVVRGSFPTETVTARSCVCGKLSPDTLSEGNIFETTFFEISLYPARQFYLIFAPLGSGPESLTIFVGCLVAIGRRGKLHGILAVLCILLGELPQ